VKVWQKRTLVVVAAFAVVIGLFTLDFLSFGGQFRDLGFRSPGACMSLPLEASAEDIQIDRNRSVAYLSSLDRRGLVEGKAVEGTVLQIDLVADPLRADSALSSAPAGFRPHGMSLYRMGDGKQRLFVISHPEGEEHVIEIFEQNSENRFTHVGSVRDPLLVSPNAIVAVGPQQFYVANDKGDSGFLGRIAESLFRTGLSKVVYFDGESMRVAAEGLKSGVGMGLSPDGLTAYVAETLGKRVSAYTRNPLTGDLIFKQYIDIDGSPDNINVDADGTLWIAVHAKLVDLIRHFGDATHHAPTTVLRHDAGEITPIYVNDGSEISAGSVGASFAERLYIGSITEPKLLICRMR
jgi:arylesterase/paraoxonase